MIPSLSEQWFPRYAKPLTKAVLGPCLHCGGDPQVTDQTYQTPISKQRGTYIIVKCQRCLCEATFCRGELPRYPSNDEQHERDHQDH